MSLAHTFWAGRWRLWRARIVAHYDAWAYSSLCWGYETSVSQIFYWTRKSRCSCGIGGLLSTIGESEVLPERVECPARGFECWPVALASRPSAGSFTVTHAFQVDLRGIVDLLSHHLYASPTSVYPRSFAERGGRCDGAAGRRIRWPRRGSRLRRWKYRKWDTEDQRYWHRSDRGQCA